MAIFLKKFETQSAYEAAESSLILPNVSLTVDNNTVHYNPSSPTPPNPCKIITYTATSKLQEITTDSGGGMKIDAFNTAIINHNFENGLGTIEFEEEVTSIGNFAFYKCSDLISIEINDCVAFLGAGVFRECNNLKYCIFGSGISNLGQSFTWLGCQNIESITIYAATPPDKNGYNTNFENIPTIYVPSDYIDIYKSAWSDYASKIQAIP